MKLILLYKCQCGTYCCDNNTVNNRIYRLQFSRDSKNARLGDDDKKWIPEISNGVVSLDTKYFGIKVSGLNYKKEKSTNNALYADEGKVTVPIGDNTLIGQTSAY
ncbi:MAG: hypothetical protein ACEPOW_12930, partial [Bacteroidales bacterium]